MTAAAPIGDVIDVDQLDLTSPAGVVSLLAACLGQLAKLPLDTKCANALAQCVTAQRAAIETSTLSDRLAALEDAAHTRPRLA